MLYKTRGAYGQCLELPEYYLRIELYNKSDGALAGALPKVTSVQYDDEYEQWIVINDYVDTWAFDCDLYNMYIFPAEQQP